jgi:hypothetical protein
MSGKLGGMVFTKTKGHQTVRSYIKNARSLSASQIISRQNFSNYSKVWKSLVAPVPNNWNAFASDPYSPLYRTNVGQYSGYQAFVGCQIAANNRNKWLTPCVCVLNGGLGTLSFTGLNDIASFSPENSSVTPFLRRSVSPAMPLLLINCSFSSAGILTARVLWGHSPGLIADMPGFADSNSLSYGFMFYMSEKLPSTIAVPKHPLRQILASTGTMLVGTPNLVGSSWMDMTFSSNLLIQNSKQFPGSGSIVQITCVVVSPRGTQAIVGSSIITIS